MLNPTRLLAMIEMCDILPTEEQWKRIKEEEQRLRYRLDRESEEFQSDLINAKIDWIDYGGKIPKDNIEECRHDMCESCHGTGTNQRGGTCVHAISCPCPKHTVMC